ncbi:L,D-transpeptidase family protein [Denitrificimonas sp. JX-1]|uniref:L,D-transpeptidase family protein n=1 Tax=Denitrificimonas halotolerans TaxID=3098930 RepID=A0ABU5GNW9_9GAMM|nr:L,D-transpeptidase family protein [Denitrificimonas sp. JX-1]MDY7218192.1 L,D-transpeptidase family protein [Denitrificimonas sp. JX-1]
MRAIFIFITLLLPLFSYASSPQLPARHFIDKVLVVKSERSLHLMHRGDIIKTYRVSLGKKPGKKEYEGDQRTPEGTYWINWRRPSKNYNLSMHISYPNASDLKRAQELGRSAGSMIMLHGTPIDGEYPEWFFHSLNWTDGCIALKNDDMKEVWNLVKDGTLIEITP